MSPPALEAAEEAMRLHYAHVNLFESPGKELFARFIEDEENFVAPESYVNDWDKKALRRTAAATVESLCNNCYDAMIPYLAMTYFDRFLSRRRAKIPNVAKGNKKLFVICCVTLAGKLRTKRFQLQTFLEEKGVLKDYQIKNVINMELLICKGLNWQMQTLTPFSFIGFYIPFLKCPPNVPVPSRLVHNLIIRSQCDIAFAEIRPSVLALCAVLIVSSKVLPHQHDFFDLKIITDVEPLRLQRNMVLKCIKMLGPLYRSPPICINPRAKAVHQLPKPRPEASSSQAQLTADEEATRIDHEYKVEVVRMDFELGWDEWLTECKMRDGPLQSAWKLKMKGCWGGGHARIHNPEQIVADELATAILKSFEQGGLEVEELDEAAGAPEADGEGVEEGLEGQHPQAAGEGEAQALPRILLCTTFTPRFLEMSAILQEFSRIGEIIVVCTHNAMEFANFGANFNAGFNLWNDVLRFSLIEEENRVLSQELIAWAEYLVVCPASANNIAKITVGICDDLVTTVIKEFPRRYVVVPDMVESAWSSGSNRACFTLLRGRGVVFMRDNINYGEVTAYEQHAGPMTHDYHTLAEKVLDYIKHGLPRLPE